VISLLTHQRSGRVSIHPVPPPADASKKTPWFTQVAVWNQRAARAEGIPAVWDYHVVLVLRPLSGQGDAEDEESIRTGSLIYDFDTTLDLPHDAQGGYLIHTIVLLVGQQPRLVERSLQSSR